MEYRKNRESRQSAFYEKLLLMGAGLSLYLVLSNWNGFTAMWNHLLATLSPFLAGIAIAYILDIPVSFLEKHGFRSRGAAVFAGVVLFGLGAALLLTQLIPVIWENIQVLAWNLPYYYDRTIHFLKNISGLVGLTPEGLLEMLQEQRQQITDFSRLFADILYGAAMHLQQVLEYSLAIGNVLLKSITAFISAIYMLLDKEKLLSQTRKAVWALLGRRQVHWLFRVGQVANRMCKAFLEGKCIDGLVVGLLTFMVMQLLNLPYVGLLALVVGVTNIVPIAGPVLGGAFGFFLLALENPAKGCLFLIAIIALQQLDGKLLGPLILGDRVGLSTLWVLVALVLGGKIAGVLGMILGVPMLATVIAIGGEVMTQYQNQRHASRIAVRILEEDEAEK